MIKKELNIYNNKKLVIEVGDIAKLANGSCVVKFGDTAVLSTVVISQTPIPEEDVGDFLPLTVDYRERTYSAGKIPGGFFKREGRPSEREILISRMIDRTIRPLFPESLRRYEIQVNCLVLSYDGENVPEVPALIGTSTALMISDIPFDGPVSCLKEKDNDFFDIIVSCLNNGDVVMFELGAREAKEEKVIEVIKKLQDETKKINQLQLEIQKEVGKQKLELKNIEIIPELKVLINSQDLKQKILDIITVQDKNERQKRINILKQQIFENNPELQTKEKQLNNVLYELMGNMTREFIIKNNIRPDNRKFDELRKITCSIDILPRTHGSAIFTRGQTQSLATVTLGTPQDMQLIDELSGEYKERFLFHYNFPGFATSDIKIDRGPSRREIGHGALAKKAIYPLLPSEKEFPYTIRLVSDILESNGSSSMASVCGASLALFDAGVPLSKSIAGIAMGLIRDENKEIILTDIAGMEDHCGDMDFKVAGTKDGITAVQLDLKIQGINLDTIYSGLQKAKQARLEILGIMDSVISKPKTHLSDFAPKLIIMDVPLEKIGNLIGPGGKNIKQILKETDTEINIEEEGKVYISGTDNDSVEQAKKLIEYYTKDIEIGQIYQGKVTKITDFGVFVEILPGKEGLVHISQLENYRVRKVSDVVKEGEEILVKVIDIDNQGRIVLSKKAVKNNGKKQY